jgi:hypothetical protein
VAIIELFSQNAPEVGGIRVGDSTAVVHRKWGPPYRDGSWRSSYRTIRWAVLVESDTIARRVIKLSFGFVPPGR